MLFDKGSSWRHLFSHEHRKHMLCSDYVRQCYAYQSSLSRIHCRLPKLFRVHLAQTFISLDLNIFSAMNTESIDKLFECKELLFFISMVNYCKEYFFVRDKI